MSALETREAVKPTGLVVAGEFDFLLPAKSFDYLEAVRLAGRTASKRVEKLIETMVRAEEGQLVRLARRSLASIGLAEGDLLEDIDKAAAVNRLGRCPQQTGVALGAVYTDQPEGEWLYVLSDLIKVEDNGRSEECLIGVINDSNCGGQVLHAPPGRLESCCSPRPPDGIPFLPTREFIFRLMD